MRYEHREQYIILQGVKELCNRQYWLEFSSLIFEVETTLHCVVIFF